MTFYMDGCSGLLDRTSRHAHDSLGRAATGSSVSKKRIVFPHLMHVNVNLVHVFPKCSPYPECFARSILCGKLVLN